MKLERVARTTGKSRPEIGSNVVSFPRAPSRNSIAERIGFVDNAKAIGILLVVLGHATGTPFVVRTLIYAVHMPLFFFLSGYLVSPSRLGEPASVQIKRLSRTLLAPYLVFFFLSYAYWLITRHIGARALKFQHISWTEPLMGLFTGLGQDMFVNPALWFLPCLFTVSLGYWALRIKFGQWIALALALVGALVVMTVMPESRWRLPWGLDNGWVALCFFATAVAIHSNAADGMSLSRPVRAALCVVLLGAFGTLATRMGPVDLNMALFGPSPTIYFVTAGTGIAALVALSSLWQPGTIATWLSRNTLIIFPTHPIVMNLASGVAKLIFKVPDSALDSITWSIFSTALGLLAAIPIGYLLRRLLPRIFFPSSKLNLV